MKRGGGGAGNPNSSMPRPKIKKIGQKTKIGRKKGGPRPIRPPPPPWIRHCVLLEMSRIYTLAPRDVTRTAVCTYLAHYYTQRTYILSVCSLPLTCMQTHARAYKPDLSGLFPQWCRLL